MPPTNQIPTRSHTSPHIKTTLLISDKKFSNFVGEKDEDVGILQPQRRFTASQLLVARIIFALSCYFCYLKAETFQDWIDTCWGYLRDQWWFQTVYFETLLVVVYSFPPTFFFMIIDKISYFDKFRVSPKGGLIYSESMQDILFHAVEYILPLSILDTLHVKHYYGVTDDVIIQKRLNWIQRTRALPEYSPRLSDIIIHISVAIVIYDIMFFIIHYNLHKYQILYRTFHKKHHTHVVINAKATDHQNWIERIVFILSANAGLKVQGAHPFTRTIFVFVFVTILIYNHCGYDFPWTFDKLIPGDIFSGSREHYVHHAKGKRHYQFCFTYLDKGLDWLESRKKNKKL
ncbi:cholesterol 25-hydroxylase-like protein [Styela clava]|uniref:cholesterol 25-hydroxylase-like protein n=1 Tax=Styela clava TaxID=7725 RepID=UPI00193A0A58|nr:cholesterol 25-hydroxylase-like protein [Styela clava]